MPFDLTPLTPRVWVLFAASTAAVWLALLERQRTPRSGPYAGVTLVVIITAFALLAVPTTLGMGLLAAALLIVAVGRYDEQYQLSARWQFIWQAIIAAIVVSAGWRIPYVSDPFGGGVLSLGDGALLSVGSLVAVGWLVFLMNAINWFDGVDGLAGTVAAVALATLAAISVLPATQDGTTLALSLIGLGSVLSFLRWNWAPATMYLGTVGSWFIGLYVGLVATLGGGKIATTALVLVLPLLDVLLVIIQRLWHRQPPWQGDTVRHLHYRLRSRGLPAPHIALLAGGVSILCGIAAVLLQTRAKLFTFGLIAVGMGLVTLYLITSDGRRTVKR